MPVEKRHLKTRGKDYEVGHEPSEEFQGPELVAPGGGAPSNMGDGADDSVRKKHYVNRESGSGGLGQVTGGAETACVMDALTALNSTLTTFGKAIEENAARVMAIEAKLSGSNDQLTTRDCSGKPVIAEVNTSALAETQCCGFQTQRRDSEYVGRHFAKPQEFDGSCSWISFITQFETIATIHGWSAPDKLGELVGCLKGPALELFAHLPAGERSDYHSLSLALSARFGVTGQETLFRSQLRHRTRRAGEALPSLAQDIERLVSLAYPSASQELQGSLACDQFVDALSDVDLQIAVRQGRPSSLRETLASALEIEAIRISSNHGSTNKSVPAFIRAGQAQLADTEGQSSGVPAKDVLQNILRSLKALEKAVAAPASGWGRGRGTVGRGRGFRAPAACWGCGNTGHLQRTCPQAPGQAPERDASSPGN